MTLFMAIVLDYLLGDPQVSFHPVRLIGRLIAGLERGLRRLFPKTRDGEAAAGILLVILTVLISTAVPMLILYLAGKVNSSLQTVLDIFLSYTVIAARSLQTESMKVETALEKGDIAQARAAVSQIVGRDTQRLDQNGIARAAVETVAENTSDGVIAPLLFLAVGGAPLGYFYKAVNTLDSMVGYRNEKYRIFGRAAAKTDDVLNFIPSRISGLLIILAAGLHQLSDDHYSMADAFRIFRRDRRRHASPNSAQTESAVAGALGLRLAGSAYYFGELYKKPYIGDARREIEPADIARANSLMYAATFLFAGLCLLARRLIFALI